MTVSTITSRVTYVANGATTEFAIPFPFYQADDIEVVERLIATGAETVKEAGTGYSVSGGNGATGTVTAAVAPPSTVHWVIRRATPLTQEIDYVENDPFPAATHEEGLDRAAMRVIDMREQVDRAPKFPVSDPSSAVGDYPSSVARAGKALTFDAAGKPAATAFVDLAASDLTVSPGDAGLPVVANAAETGVEVVADAATFRATLGLAIGTDVQAFQAAQDQATWEAGTGTTESVVSPAKVAAAVAALAAGNNILINGGMSVYQRGGIVTSNADDTYALDCWNILTQTGAVAASQLTDVENGTPYMMRITQSQASAQRFGAEQILEARNCKWARGESVVLSARVRCSASTTLRYAILEWTGTEDSVTSDVVNDWTSAALTAGNFFLAANLTVTATGSVALTANTLADITALTATLGSSMNNLVVLFWTDSTQAQNVTLDIGNVQLELGSVATPMKWRSAEVELALCQRYSWLIQSTTTSFGIGFGQNNSTTVAQAMLNPPVQLRIPATGITVSTASNFRVSSGAADVACTSIAFAITGRPGPVVNFTVASGLAAGNGALIYTDSASSYILVTGGDL